MKKFKPIYFYITFFIVNLINVYIITYGIIHPNVSSYTFNISSFVISVMGNVSITLLLFGLSIIFFKKTKPRLNFLVITSLVLTIVCLGLAIFANIFSTFFKSSQLLSFNNPSQGNFFLFYAQYTLNMLADFTQSIHLLPFFLLVIVRIFTDDSYIEYYQPAYKLAILVFSIMFFSLPIVKLNKKVNSEKILMNPLYAVTEAGLYNYYLYDLYQFLDDKQYNTTQNDINSIASFLNEYSKETYINPIDNKTYTIANEYTGLAKDKNLIIVQLEAFNNFVIDLVVDGVEITPNLNRLKSNGLSYKRFYSTAGIGNTSDCEFSSLTGLYGNGDDLTTFNYSGSNYETLAKDFKKNGYITFSSHGNYGGFYNRDREHLNTLGFDAHYDLQYFESLDNDVPLIHSYLDDKYFFEHFVDIMPQEKFFAYGISVTSHSPYVPTKEIYQHNFPGLTRLASSYLDFCHYTDAAIGIYLDSLEKANLLDDSILVFYGDHTSSLFKPDLESVLNTKLNEADFRLTLQSVPLIIYNENIFNNKINSKVTGTVDLYRSFSNLFGLKSKYYFGNDLFTDEPSYIYNPRNLDLIFDDFTCFYPSKKVYGNLNNNLEYYLQLFEEYKYVNDLILKTHFFR